jgi:alkylation response protein AidB-like acyl-CoA dehydrogenase
VSHSATRDVPADGLVAAAAAMRDTLRDRQAECEALGRLPDATNQEYIDAGFFRVLQPRRFGGYELGLEAFLRIACSSSAPGRTSARCGSGCRREASSEVA